MNRVVNSQPTSNDSLQLGLGHPVYILPGHCISKWTRVMLGLSLKWNKQLSSFLRRLLRPGKGSYFLKRRAECRVVLSRRFHSFSPRYLGIFAVLSVLVFWVVFGFLLVLLFCRSRWSKKHSRSIERLRCWKSREKIA